MTTPNTTALGEINLKMVEALRIAAGDIVYLANERGELDRFGGTLKMIADALEPTQFMETTTKQGALSENEAVEIMVSATLEHFPHEQNEQSVREGLRAAYRALIASGAI